MTMINEKDSIGLGGGVNKVFFTSDTHFGHKLMAKYRGFENIDEMDKAMIQKWNERVKPGDIVYHLGDFSFRNKGETIGVLRRLNGAVRLVKGNHDRVVKGDVYREFDWVRDYYEVRLPDGRKIVLSHFPFLTWNKAHYGSWHCHGHCHGSLKVREGRRMDVGVDTNDLYPYSMEEVAEYMETKGFESVDHHTPRKRGKSQKRKI